MPSERIQRQIDALLDDAEAAVKRFDWEAVRQNARAVLRLDPGNEDALTYLAAAESDEAAGSAIPPISPPAPLTAPAPAHPTTFANGRYQVKKFLGEGGKKKVYLAHDTLLRSEE